jgi:hypothetical protein
MDPENAQDAVLPPPQPAGAVHPAPAATTLTLQPFWTSNPEAWFALAEGQFYLRHITDPAAQFYIAASAVPETFFSSMTDLLRRPPPPDAYEVLKARLLASHTLTEYQRMEMLTQHKPLGGQRPSEMLTEISRYCPAGEAGTKLFRFNFLSRLPQELRIILSEDVVSTLPVLAARADTLWSHTSQRSGVNALADDQADVSAIDSQQRRHNNANKKKRGRGGRFSSSDRKKQVDSGLCYAHYRFGEEAFACKKPCAWSEN